MTPKIYLASTHHIRNEQISPHALTVLRRLHEADFVAYLVGGGVRDLLLHKKPKDFDISTSAKPEDVKRIFGRQCILIGRRFRLAHIRFGEEIVEVATFRAGDPSDATLITRDNVFGTPEEDVYRRDFTINGLFYDPLDHKIIDYVGGFQDLQEGILRVIGDPYARFAQDPVRMIRLLKFQARFDLKPEKTALQALNDLRFEIQKSSSARVVEEMLRMLESGAAAPFFALLHESGFLEILFPELDPYFAGEFGKKILGYLQCADAMNFRGHYRPLERAILVSSLLYPIFEEEVKIRSAEKPTGMLSIGEIIHFATLFVEQHCGTGFLPFPRHMRYQIHTILHTQYRLTPLDTKRRSRERIVRQRDFLLALTFLKLRALIQSNLFRTYEHWKRIWKGQKSPDADDA